MHPCLPNMGMANSADVMCTDPPPRTLSHGPGLLLVAFLYRSRSRGPAPFTLWSLLGRSSLSFLLAAVPPLGTTCLAGDTIDS